MASVGSSDTAAASEMRQTAPLQGTRPTPLSSTFTAIFTFCLLIASTFPTAMAASTPAEVCNTIDARFPGAVAESTSPEYPKFKTSYFAAFENEISPACVLYSKDAHELAVFIRSSALFRFTVESS